MNITVQEVGKKNLINYCLCHALKLVCQESDVEVKGELEWEVIASPYES